MMAYGGQENSFMAAYNMTVHAKTMYHNISWHVFPHTQL